MSFTTAFLYTRHSLLAKLGRWGWLRRMRLTWKKSQNTLDTSKRLHQNKTEAQGMRPKDFIPNFAIIGNCRLITTWRVLGGGEIHTLRRTTYHGTIVCRRSQSKYSCFVWGSFITDLLQVPPSRFLRHVGWGLSIITQILHRYPFTRYLSRSRYALPLSVA